MPNFFKFLIALVLLAQHSISIESTNETIILVSNHSDVPAIPIAKAVANSVILGKRLLDVSNISVVNETSFNTSHQLNSSNNLLSILLYKSVGYKYPLLLINSTSNSSFPKNASTYSQSPLVKVILMKLNDTTSKIGQENNAKYVLNGTNYFSIFNFNKTQRYNQSSRPRPVIPLFSSISIALNDINSTNQSLFLRPPPEFPIFPTSIFSMNENETASLHAKKKCNENALNQTVFLFKIVSIDNCAFLNDTNSTFETIKLQPLLWRLMFLQKLIKQSLEMHHGNKVDIEHVRVSLSNKTLPLSKNLTQTSLVTYKLPIYCELTVLSNVKIEESELEEILFHNAINRVKCKYNQNFNKSQSPIVCLNELRDEESLLHINDLWIHICTNITRSPTMFALEGESGHVFNVQPAWVIGLIVIGSIIAVFFIGCLIAVCYTRRPYKRSSKVYEIESSKSKKRTLNARPQQIPQIPSVNPATKASTITKSRDNKEFYY